MPDLGAETCDWDGARPSRRTGRWPSIVGTLGLVAVGVVLVRAGSEGPVEGWAGPSATCRVMIEGRECPVFAMAWSPDGRKLAVSGYGPIVRVWDRESGRLGSIEGAEARPRFVEGWSPDGRRLILGGLDVPAESWDMASPLVDKEAREVTRPTDREGVVRMIAEASRGGPIRVRGEAESRSTWLPASAHAAIWAAFAPDGRSIATVESDLSLRIWDAPSGRLRQTIGGAPLGFGSVAFSPDGSKVAAGGGGSVRVWDANSGAPLASLGQGICGSAIIAFSPDGTRLAGACWDATIRVWDLATGLERAKLGGHDGQILSLGWSPDGQTLASGGYDSTVRLWDVAGPVEVARLGD
jgi:WD40 repeat protein